MFGRRLLSVIRPAIYPTTETPENSRSFGKSTLRLEIRPSMCRIHYPVKSEYTMNEVHRLMRLLFREVAAGMRPPFLLLANMQLTRPIYVKYLRDLDFCLLNCGLIQKYFVVLQCT